MSEPSDDEDLGEPIAELAELREEPTERLLTSVRSRILDRMFAGQMVDFTLPVLLKILLEYVSMAFGMFASAKPEDETEPKDKTEKKP